MRKNLLAALGWIVWTLLSLPLRIAAALGARWARKRLDERQRHRRIRRR